MDSVDGLNAAMSSLKSKGFINYYGMTLPVLRCLRSLRVIYMILGMQRFGTASVPTHSVGLALLQSDWHKAVSMILGHRPGEHPDVVAARDAWLVEHDLEKALSLMPRRVVAERCILESYKKQNGETRNAMGALSTVRPALLLLVTDYNHLRTKDPSYIAPHVCACIPIIRLERHSVGEN